MREFGSIVEGQQHSSGKWIDVYNPFTLEQTGRVAAIDPKAVNEIAKKMHDSDVRLSRHERHNILMKMSAEIESRSDDVSRLITDETGLARKDTRYEAQRVCDVLRFSAMAALQDDSEIFPCDISAQGRPRRIYTSRYPLRLITAITPFNHPMNQVAHKIGPAIATNNNVILKPSEKTPLSAYFLAELSIQCGLPVESLTVLNGSTKDLAKAMVTHELVDLVTFTGSSSVGRHLASLAKYKRLILELGGSSPLLVLEDADPAVAAQIAVAGIFKNSGQRCTAIRRIIVQEKIAAPFADSLKKEVALLRCGDPYDDKTDVGTVISETAARQIQARVENSLSQGSKLLIGNHREGALYHPTVLDKVNPAHDLVAQETFGPVAPIIRVDSFNEAIRLANDTCYGLSAGVVSNHWPSIQRAIGELEVGTVNINEAPSYRLETTPFGGIKASGLGYKEGVIETMKAMTYIKTYSLPWDQP
tara:strand:+ start:5735 stop:7159 length:1425 start_codon:yes stop_codon:yes gene_type:complete